MVARPRLQWFRYRPHLNARKYILRQFISVGVTLVIEIKKCPQEVGLPQLARAFDTRTLRCVRTMRNMHTHNACRAKGWTISIHGLHSVENLVRIHCNVYAVKRIRWSLSLKTNTVNPKHLHSLILVMTFERTHADMINVK